LVSLRIASHWTLFFFDTIIFPSSIPSDYVLRALPIISEDYHALASKITAAFTGDPSFFAYNGEEEEPEAEDPDAPPVERFRELHRLVYVVKVNRIYVLVCRMPSFIGYATMPDRKLITNVPSSLAVH